MKANTLLSRIAITLGLLAAPAGVQTAARAADAAPIPANDATAGERAVELSPFVIRESSDTGWVATETLAGSRLRTNFKDVPNQIETLTKDFMQDLALTNFDEALIYTANVENLKTDYTSVNDQTDLKSPDTAGRIRGLTAGTTSRNFFPVTNQTDNFNLERATIAAGPNAILFGLGSPAGILDATPARAMMRNKYGFQLQYDSEDSKRATFDANTMIVPQKLAARIMGLSKKEYTHKKPNLDRDERLYGAVTFTPFKHTSLILEGERAKRNWNRPSRYTPYDNISPWYLANTIAGSGYTVPKPVFNNTNLTTIGTNAIFTQAGQNPVSIQSGSTPGPLQSWRNSVVVKNPNVLPGVNSFDAANPYTILDPSIYPFDRNNFGTTRGTLIGAYTKTAILEQRLAPDLFLELGYNYENSYNKQVQVGGLNGSTSLFVDANQFLPGTTTPNPYLGKLYTQGPGNDVFNLQRHEDWRGTLSYEIDLARKFSDRGKVAQWFGRHRLFGLYTRSTAESKQQQGAQFKILDDPVLTGITLTPKTTSGWANNATRMPMFRYYLSDLNDTPNAPGPMQGGFTMTDANGRPFTLYQWDTPLRDANGKRLGPNTAATASLNKISSEVFAWQGFFLPDRENQSRLIVTYGYRKDKGKSATLDNASVTTDFSGLVPTLWDTRFGPYGATQTGINRNIGIVARPVKWFTGFYNHSTTFDLNVGKYDPFGNDIPGAGGKGKDFGFRVDLGTDQVALRVNRYENSIGPINGGGEFGSYRDTYFNIESRVLQLDPSLPTINTTDGNMHGYRVAGRTNYQITENLVSKGYEVELDLTPLRNWNIRLNGSKTQAVESSVGGVWFAWGLERLPIWQKVVAKNGEKDAAGNPLTWKTAPRDPNSPTGQTLEQYYNTVLLGQEAYMKAVDGRANNARPARVNAITNYRFTEGVLRGVNVGGALRWRSAPVIGFGLNTVNGNTLVDLDRKYYGPEEFFVDAMVGYRGQIKAFGRYNYRVQLNVRNVLDKNDAIPVTKISTGATVRLATVEPRLIIGSFAVEF